MYVCTAVCSLTDSNILDLSRVACGMNRFLFDEMKRGAERAIHDHSYSNLILTCPRCNLLLQTTIYTLCDGCINVSSTLEKTPDKTSLSGDGQMTTLAPELPVERLVICCGEILNCCKSQVQHLGRSKTADNTEKRSALLRM